jgi:bifunctional non-homologous end joining protein LigD
MPTKVSDNLGFVEPMMALTVKELPVGNWIYELKFDGYRGIAVKSDKEVRLVSRNRTNFSDDYPQLIQGLKQLPAKSATLDGEIVAVDQNGRPSFQLLQGYGKTHNTWLVYYAFDLLFLEGTDLRSRPLIERRRRLAKLPKKAPENIKFSEELQGSKRSLLRSPKSCSSGTTTKTNSCSQGGSVPASLKSSGDIVRRPAKDHL